MYLYLQVCIAFSLHFGGGFTTLHGPVAWLDEDFVHGHVVRLRDGVQHGTANVFGLQPTGHKSTKLLYR